MTTARIVPVTTEMDGDELDAEDAWRLVVAVLLTLLVTGVMTVYVHVSPYFDSTYGPLAGIVDLLQWSLLSAMAFFYGVAVCAQLEALRAGDHSPAYDDPGRPHGQVVEN